jgi:hypothetical protein
MKFEQILSHAAANAIYTGGQYSKWTGTGQYFLKLLATLCQT